MRSATAVLILAALVMSRPASAQQRPLDTQDPETIGAGNLLTQIGIGAARRESYPLSGLQGNLWQAPLLGFVFGLSPIADLQITGGPYDRLYITGRRPAPLASLVTATGTTTHAVDDIVLGTKVRVIPETSDRPALGLRFSVRLPNAKHDSGMGQDTTDFSASILSGKTMAALRLVGNVGITIMSEPLDAAKQNDVLTYGLSLGTGSPAAQLVAEVNGRKSTRPGTAPIGTESRGTAKVGGRFAHGRARYDIGLLFGLTPTDPQVGATLGVTYTFKAFHIPDSTQP
jgi:hypothetical protein